MSHIIELTEPVRYTTFNNLKGNTKSDNQNTWPEIVAMLRNPEVYARKGACPLLVMATFGDKPTASGCLRHADNVLTVTGIECDYDGEQLSIEVASDTLRMFGIRAVLFTSASHTPEKPRWRILLPLSRPHAPEERHALVARVNGLLRGVLAIESFTLSQSYYYGKVEGVTYEVRECDGECIDKVEFLDAGAIGPARAPAKVDPVDDDLILPPASDEKLADLDSALTYMAGKGYADHYPEWSSVGMALKAESRNGRELELKGLWLKYSRGSSRFAGEAITLQKWEKLDGKKTGIAGGVFKKAQDMGWTNPATGRVAIVVLSSRYKRLSGSDLRNLPPMVWRVRGVLPAVGLASIYGASKAGKSFLCIDLACAIAEGLPWFDHRVEAAPVVYVALEGEAGFKQRVGAWEVRNGRDLPEGFSIVMQPFNLTTVQDVADLAAVVPAGAVVFLDTLRRAAPTSDENASKDMGEILEGAKRLMTAINGLVIVVHHTGKNEAHGMRGHSSLLGALDASLEVSRSGDKRSWKSDKVKEGEDGGVQPFKLEVVTVGLDDNDELITSCVVVADTAPATRAEGAIKWPATVMLETLIATTEQHGKPPPTGIKHLTLGFDDDLRVVPEPVWRQACYAAGIAKEETSQDGRRTAFTRARDALLQRNLIQIADGFVWKG